MQILSAYFVVLPLRDEGAISLGLGALPGLFVGSLLLTVLAAPVASLVFSLPSIPKTKVRPFVSWGRFSLTRKLTTSPDKCREIALGSHQC
jgi:hypothetical protein